MSSATAPPYPMASTIRAGIEFLDEIDTELLDDLDLDRLNLQSGEDCVLGQIASQIVVPHPNGRFSRFMDYRIFLDVDRDEAEDSIEFRLVSDADYLPLFELERHSLWELGFALPHPITSSHFFYELLTREWLAILDDRSC